MCQVLRVAELTRFIHMTSFIIINVENDQSNMTQLPDPLLIGDAE